MKIMNVTNKMNKILDIYQLKYHMIQTTMFDRKLSTKMRKMKLVSYLKI